MDKLKTLLTAFAFALIAGFFVWAMLPRDNFSDKISEQINKDKEKADVIFKDATLSEIYDGVKYWELVSNTSVVNKSTGISNLSDVDGLFFSSGKPAIKFLAPSAVWLMDKNEIQLVDPIGYDVKMEKRVKAELAKVKDIKKLYSVFHLPEKAGEAFDGYWFQSKRLHWTLSTKKLICEGSIYLTKGDVVVKAEKLEADVGMENVILTGNPSAKILTDGESINITANKFIIESSTDRIFADSNVKMINGGSRISSSNAIYDQRTASIALTGDVFLTDSKIQAFSKLANYDIRGKKVVLNEKAKAKRDGNEVYGDKMTVFLGQNRIVINGKTKANIQKMDIQ